MGAALCSVYGWVILRLVVKDHAVSPLMANGTSMLFGGLLAFGHSFLVEGWNPLPFQVENIAPVLKGTLLMTLVSTFNT